MMTPTCGTQSLYSMSLDFIEEDTGFILRDMDADATKELIESLAQQWFLDPSAIPPMVVTLKDGKVYVRDGFCRLRAAKIAIERGAKIDTVTVLLREH